MKLFIHAGGKGTRLYPLTKNIPKPLVPVCGKPVLHHLIDWAKSTQVISSIVLLNGHLAEKIVDNLGDGSNFGINVVHSNEPSALGSGGAIKFANQHINGTFVCLSGDHLCEVDLRKMLDFHRKNNADITVLVHKSSHPCDSDILKVNTNQEVIQFISKHDDHTNSGDLSNSGLCIIEPKVLDLIGSEMVFNFETYLYPKIISSGMRMMGYYTEEFMSDMGTPERLQKCENYLRNKKT
ncbi:MAG TPA: nucleotidyltransferase family protein [Candidatus Nanoarchaeia archaeon]|nr:nucleotidyltransferase family protein [Candidatus Nanoarchaeia archaeon]